MPKSYILPTFEAWALPLRNALLERLPVSFAFGKDLPAKLEVLPCAAAFAPAAELTLTIDGHPWRDPCPSPFWDSSPNRSAAL